MLSKMILALKYEPSEVTLVENVENRLKDLESLSSSKRVLFFGEDFPGRFGEALHWAGHQVIRTHDLTDLLNRPELKKQTLAHLKLFASL